jgi:ABC-type transporter Mla maintaining outer membrane lipid asymmetry ATPase subunit MlaF
MEQEPIVEARGLTAAYGEEIILQDVSLGVKRGEIFVLLGSSGCGTRRRASI